LRGVGAFPGGVALGAGVAAAVTFPIFASDTGETEGAGVLLAPLGLAVGAGVCFTGVGTGVSGPPTNIRWRSEGFFGVGDGGGTGDGEGEILGRTRGRGVAAGDSSGPGVVASAGDAAGAGGFTGTVL